MDDRELRLACLRHAIDVRNIAPHEVVEHASRFFDFVSGKGPEMKAEKVVSGSILGGEPTSAPAPKGRSASYTMPDGSQIVWRMPS